MTTNNVTRLLDSLHVRYSIFELPAEKISAIETAELLSVPPEIVYKTIVVVVSDNKPILCIIPGNREVNLKRVADLLHEKKVHVATQAVAETLTKLKTGGISPLALINRGFRMIIDDTVHDQEEIHISGGQRGLNIRINVEDLLKILHPLIAQISDPLID